MISGKSGREKRFARTFANPILASEHSTFLATFSVRCKRHYHSLFDDYRNIEVWIARYLTTGLFKAFETPLVPFFIDMRQIELKKGLTGVAKVAEDARNEHLYKVLYSQCDSTINDIYSGAQDRRPRRTAN
jgi:DNA-binding phage protein